MTATADPRPTRLTPFPNGEIGVAWNDGHESFFDGYTLRCACTCASCVDELTGTKILQDATVPKSVRAEEIHPVGRYGVAVRWSDGHDTGIYTFRRLRELCGCEACA